MFNVVRIWRFFFLSSYVCFSVFCVLCVYCECVSDNCFPVSIFVIRTMTTLYSTHGEAPSESDIYIYINTSYTFALSRLYVLAFPSYSFFFVETKKGIYIPFMGLTRKRYKSIARGNFRVIFLSAHSRHTQGFFFHAKTILSVYSK